jgi:hypothetical protein
MIVGWVRLDDSFAEDPRFETAGPLALALYVAGLCYCNRNLTDGVIPKARALRLLALDEPATVIKALVDSGLWADRGGTVSIADFSDWQPSRVEVEKRRADTAERQERWRNNRDASRNASRNTVTNAVTNGTPSRPVPTRREGTEGQGPEGVRSSAGAPDLPPTKSTPPATKGSGFSIETVDPNHMIITMAPSRLVRGA